MGLVQPLEGLGRTKLLTFPEARENHHLLDSLGTLESSSLLMGTKRWPYGHLISYLPDWTCIICSWVSSSQAHPAGPGTQQHPKPREPIPYNKNFFLHKHTHGIDSASLSHLGWGSFHTGWPAVDYCFQWCCFICFRTSLPPVAACHFKVRF